MRTCATILCLLLTVPAYAVDTLQVTTPDPVTEQWRWQTIDGSNGLEMTVQHVLPDNAEGIYVVGREGLQHYDGYDWVIHPTPEGVLEGENIFKSICARDGGLWFATARGVYRYIPPEDPAAAGVNDRWTIYNAENGLPRNRSNQVVEGPDGTIWAATYDGSPLRSSVARFRDGSWEHVDFPAGLSDARAGPGCLAAGSDGSIWLSTRDHGLLVFPAGADGPSDWHKVREVGDGKIQNLRKILVARNGMVWLSGNSDIRRFDPSGLIRHGESLETDWVIYPVEGFEGMWQTEDGTLWAGTAHMVRGKLGRFDGARWHTYEPPDIPLAISASPRGLALGESTADGDMWIYNAFGEAIHRIDLGGPITTYIHADTLGGGIESDDGSVWFRSRTAAIRLKNRVWSRFGAEDGFLNDRVATNPGRFRNPLALMQRTADGSIWYAGGYDGQPALARFREGAWTIYSEGVVEIHPVARREDFLLDAGEGVIYAIGSHEGRPAISRFDPHSGSWRRYATDDLPAGHFVHGFYGSDGAVWLGHIDGNPNRGGAASIVRYSPNTGPWEIFNDTEDYRDRWTSVSGITEWPKGMLRMGVSNGLRSLDLRVNTREWQKLKMSVLNPSPHHLTALPEELWFGFHPMRLRGAARYGGTDFEEFRVQDGLAVNSITQIELAADGAVWLAGIGGLSRYDRRTDAGAEGPEGWFRFGAERGLDLPEMGHLHEATDGSFWITGGSKNVIHFRYPDLEDDPPRTKMDLAEKEVSPSGNTHFAWSGVDRWADTKRYELRYEWRLHQDGHIGEWESNSTRRDHTFTALSQGDYTFEVRAVDRDGIVEETPAVHTFTVAPPLWRNPWVMSFAFVMIGLVGLQSVRLVRRDKRLRHSNEALSTANNELFQVNVDLQREQVLERLRGQAQGMQSSEDIGPMVEAVYRELTGLGLPLIQPSIGIYRDDERKTEIWEATSDGDALEPWVNEWGEKDPSRDARNRGDAYFHRHWEGEELRRVIRRLGEKGSPIWENVPEERWLQGGENYHVFFDTGRIQLITEEPIPEEYLMLIKRFGEVFGYAHSRWEELKVKEAQNRRLAVEASVQRLRAEVQSMDEASDFERILSLLTESLKTVELSFDGCEIDVLDEPVENPTMELFEAKGFRYTTFTLDPDGQVASESYNLLAPYPSITRQIIERFIAGEPWQGTSEGQAIVEVPAGAYGRLRLTATDRQSFDDDEVATLREFADAVALGYARYLDIREIQDQTERKSAFLASMSHELRTPMNAIKGFTNLVLRRGKDQAWERSEENLQKVSQASDHLLGMINDILDLSKIEAGRMDVNPERFDVRELVTSACDTVSPLIQEGVELRQDVADDIGEANTDKARVQQMVINLLSNAIKFTDTGSVTVSASTEDGALVIAVSDTGKGIPTDELPTIFDEYRQAEGSESSVQKGTGLGLSITKKFAELLGGTIGVESEVGKGSTFTVRVPVEYQELG